jgi:hypothetical protein
MSSAVSDRSSIGSSLKTAINEKPDFYVTYYGKARDRDWISTWSGRTPTKNRVPVVIFPNYDETAIPALQHQEGLVYFVVYDAKTRMPAWSGAISQSDPNPDFSSPQTEAAIDKLIDEFRNSA